MSTTSSRIVHSDEKRHKCHYCGRVRYESYMKKLTHLETNACSQFGNDEKCWACRGCFKTPTYIYRKKSGHLIT